MRVNLQGLDRSVPADLLKVEDGPAAGEIVRAKRVAEHVEGNAALKFAAFDRAGEGTFDPVAGPEREGEHSLDFRVFGNHSRASGFRMLQMDGSADQFGSVNLGNPHSGIKRDHDDFPQFLIKAAPYL